MTEEQIRLAERERCIQIIDQYEIDDPFSEMDSDRKREILTGIKEAISL